ncbi:MAG: fructosamine kinase family protein [Anaerolineales bacterium]
MIPASVQTWLVENGFGPVNETRSVGGGCISNGQTLTTQSGETFFLKTNAETPADMFAREAEGLAALKVDNGPRVPRPLLFGSDFILLEDLAPAPRKPNYWVDFAHQLAHLHQHTQAHFGFEHDNYIGSTRQSNPWMEDGYQFFAEQRLLFQARLAYQKGLFSLGDLKSVEKIATQLPDLIPLQPASLLHGDLWSGNVITDARGAPAIIDPAAHYGWAEAELAMTVLFGSFPSVFYQTYEEVRPLEAGYFSRFPIYNLYHLINHLNIFGRGYLGQVHAVLRRYA